MSLKTQTASPPPKIETHKKFPLAIDGVATSLGVAVFFLVLLLVVAILGVLIYTFGLWVLGITAVALVPVIFIGLLLLTIGH